MMLDTFNDERLQKMQSDELSDSLERGSVVFFPESPVALPEAEDLDFFRQELPKRLKLKNISFHPEEGRTRGLDGDDKRCVMAAPVSSSSNGLPEIGPPVTRRRRRPGWRGSTAPRRPPSGSGISGPAR